MQARLPIYSTDCNLHVFPLFRQAVHSLRLCMGTHASQTAVLFTIHRNLHVFWLFGQAVQGIPAISQCDLPQLMQIARASCNLLPTPLYTIALHVFPQIKVCVLCIRLDNNTDRKLHVFSLLRQAVQGLPAISQSDFAQLVQVVQAPLQRGGAQVLGLLINSLSQPHAIGVDLGLETLCPCDAAPAA